VIRFPLRVLVACGLLAAPSLHAADAPLTTGDSTVVRRDVTFALHIPEDLARPHGPSGVLVFFGGKNDSAEMYQQSLSSTAELLDLVLVVPQMPWFAEPGKVDEPGVIRALEQLVTEIEKQFKTTWVIVGGASAGGNIAVAVAGKWSSKVPLLTLSSTGPFPDNQRLKTFHVVAAEEIEQLGPDGKKAPLLGKGKKDVFAVPGGHHTAQLEYLAPWLESEVSALRLNIASQTMQAAQQALMTRDTKKAEGIIQSTYMASNIIAQAPPGMNSFFDYEKTYRQSLLKKYTSTIQSMQKLRTKIATTK
jgi:hypothetical protein